jgi:hypothetical protein
MLLLFLLVPIVLVFIGLILVILVSVLLVVVIEVLVLLVLPVMAVAIKVLVFRALGYSIVDGASRVCIVPNFVFVVSLLMVLIVFVLHHLVFIPCSVLC